MALGLGQLPATQLTLLSFVVITAARWIFFKSTTAFFKNHLASQHKEKGLHTAVLKLQDELWTTIGGVALLVYSWHALVVGNPADCQLADTWGCFQGWPDAQAMPAVTHVYLLVELGWYLHLLPKYQLGIGLKDDLPMHAHHFMTITLVAISHGFKLHQIGVLLLALLNVSNPVLHAAKVAHNLHAKLLDKAIFLLFALVFFVTRVIMYPAIILRCTLFRSLGVAPAFLAHRVYLSAWAVSNLFLAGLMLLQLLWMHNIIRLLLKLNAGADKFKAQAQASDFVVHAHAEHAEPGKAKAS